MSEEATLRAFSDAAGRSVTAVLQRWTEDVADGTIEIVPEGAPPLGSVELPAVVVAAWYGEQSAGGNLLTMTTRGAKCLAARIVGAQESDHDEDDVVTELELSALDEAMGHVMTAAAAASGDLLGRDIATGAPTTLTVDDAESAAKVCEPAQHVSVYTFSVCNHAAHLIQIVPGSFLTQADQRLAEATREDADTTTGTRPAEASSEDAIRGVPVRVWAELGRLRMPLARAVGLPPGVVVEFECGAEDPIELFVNGRRFATGRLLVGDGRWAVEIVDVLDSSEQAA